jgi:hypothetical protein
VDYAGLSEDGLMSMGVHPQDEGMIVLEGDEYLSSPDRQ